MLFKAQKMTIPHIDLTTEKEVTKAVKVAFSVLEFGSHSPVAALRKASNLEMMRGSCRI